MEALDIITRYGMTQRKTDGCLLCPRCGRLTMAKNLAENALSRRADVYICSGCGTEEAMRDYCGCGDDVTKWNIVNLVVNMKGE